MVQDDVTRRILAAIRAIPRGEVAGYGEVARRAGLPGRARLVARLLSGNDDPRLPWHRVLRSDGRIAFPEGSRGYREQSQRLRAEGVRVENGRVLGRRPAATLDEQIWGAPAPERAPSAKPEAARRRAARDKRS
ncbi:methylated-DNA-protein-cysteine methyltransferase-like protein [Vulcaniibacterium tengchongense]|uniref:Methylated-DNA-protein-cysteine methyltransferase-like protein n=1 Tax=Vulcaniibacterium tengchongense TaxID=1273429 RepID=A0A3N4VN85_9GAMM|nr:MGMT family protein [Vulcaniibacterium tengchongense]RPE81299.1 methylated-DNA-protein-cysteine methyltransferase-like protein [Vulcaniibacterium tengchongense]